MFEATAKKKKKKGEREEKKWVVTSSGHLIPLFWRCQGKGRASRGSYLSPLVIIIIIIIIYPITARVVGAPQMISQPVSSIFLHFSLFSAALWDLVNCRPVHYLMLSSHLFLCLPCLLHPFTVPCKIVLARPDEQETCPYHCSLCLFMMVRRSSCGLIACWILAQTSLSVTRSSYELHGILR